MACSCLIPRRSGTVHRVRHEGASAAPVPIARAPQVRNQLAAAVSTKYVLHIANDVFGAGGPGGAWLLELVAAAERHPRWWAVCPVLLERAPGCGLRLRGWWSTVACAPAAPYPLSGPTAPAPSRPPAPSARPPPSLMAALDAELCALPPAALPERLPGRPPPLLEDRCVLCRARRFSGAAPLFDRRCWSRRGVVDGAWGVWARGGAFGTARAAIAVYERPAPLGALDDDLPRYLARQHDEASARALADFNAKWQVALRGWGQ